MEIQADEHHEEVTLQYIETAQQRTADAQAEYQVITTIHRREKAIIITIVNIIRLIGYSTGFPGRIAAVPFAMAGALHLHSAVSGRTITADSYSSVSAVTGPAIPTVVTIGMGGIPSVGMVVIHRNM